MIQILNTVYHGKSIHERIQQDNIELCTILRRWNNDITSVEFEESIKTYYEEQEYSMDVAQTLINVVEDFLSTSSSTTATTSNNTTMLPETTDVFILESLFLPHPATNQSAIQKAHEELRTTPKHISIAWGNTNSKAKDYSTALEIACQTRRPVHFIICHPSLLNNNESSKPSQQQQQQQQQQQPLLTIPWQDLQSLILRNMKRLQATGRYIPAHAISDCCDRVTSLIPNNATNIEEMLVTLASPQQQQQQEEETNRHQNGIRKKNIRSSVFQYKLTSQRLIQKQYPHSNNDNNKRNYAHSNNNNNNKRNYDNPRNNYQQGNSFQRKSSSPHPYGQQDNQTDIGDTSERKRNSKPHGEARTRFPSRRKYRYNNSKEEVNYGDLKK